MKLKKPIVGITTSLTLLLVLNGSMVGVFSIVLDSTSMELRKIGEVSTSGDAFDVWVDKENEIAYVTSGYSGLRIFNISDPSNPLLLSHVPEAQAILSTGHETGYAHQLFVDDENRIVFIGDDPCGLTIVNCSDLTDPEILTHYADDGYTWDVQIVGDTVFTVNGFRNQANPGFAILDVSDLENPVSLSHVDVGGDAVDVEIDGKAAYVVHSHSVGYGGVTIFDISNHSAPEAIGAYSGPFGYIATDVEVSAPYAFLSFWEQGLKILDVSDPSNITVVGEYSNASEFGAIYLQDNYVFICVMEDGLIMLDVTDPTSPVEISRFRDTGKAYGVFARENLVFLADQDEGFKILRIEAASDNQTATTASADSTSTSLPSPGFELLLLLLGLFTMSLSWKRKK